MPPTAPRRSDTILPPTRASAVLQRAALLVMLSLAAWPPAGRAQAPAASATVDFSAPRAVTSAAGLLAGVWPTTPASHLAAVRPRLYRFSDAFFRETGYLSWLDTARQFQAVVPDAELDFNLSNTWGFPIDNWSNGRHQPPWQNWPAYETHLRGLVRTIANGGLTGTYEVWNEPDFADFWSGTRAQFHETYLRSYRAIRTELGASVPIGGPSLGLYTHEAVEAFLEFCLANGCEVNALIFHVNDDTPEGLLAHPAAVKDARASFLENPRYAPLKIARILTNEMGGPFYTRQPAGTLARYAAFEESGADAGARSCWFDSGGIAECHNGTLDGLLAHGSFQPRSVFWAHTLYAARVATRVASSVSSASLVALASRGEGSDPPQVLVGHVDFWRALNRQPANLGARLVLDNVRANPDFFRAGRVTVRVESIPDTGEAPLAAPLLLSSAPADIVAGTVSVDLPPMAVGQVLRVTLLPLEGGVPDSPLAFTTSAVGQMVSLQWSARLDGPPATGYLLEVGSAPDTANLLSLPLGNVTRFQSPAPNGVYHLRLRATNAAGAGRPTASQRVEVGCLAPPGRPLALRGTVAGPVVALTWQRGAGVIDRYVIEAGRAPGLSSIASLVIAAQSTAFQAEAPPGTYFLRVRAANDCGLSGPSAEIFLVVGAAVALPGEPGTPTVTVSGSTVSLGWVAPATGGAPTGYQLEAGTQPELADVAVATLAATPAFVTSGVPRGTYYVRLRGINQAGVGPPSADAAVVVR